jgi:hypothetical protein
LPPASGISRLRERSAYGQDNATILGNHFGHALRHQKYSRVIISIAKIRDSLSANAACLPVWKNRFEAIPNLESITAIFDGEKDHHAAFGLLGADAPLGGKVKCEILDWATVESLDCYYRDLRVRLLIHFGAQSCQLESCRLIQDAGEIIDVALGLESGWFILSRSREHRCKKAEQQAPGDPERLGQREDVWHRWAV